MNIKPEPVIGKDFNYVYNPKTGGFDTVYNESIEAHKVQLEQYNLKIKEAIQTIADMNTKILELQEAFQACCICPPEESYIEKGNYEWGDDRVCKLCNKHKSLRNGHW
jgi:hypothetical protein